MSEREPNPAGPRPDDRPVRAARCAAVVTGAAAVLLVLAAFARAPDRVETWYASSAGPLAGRTLAAVSGLVRASVAEVVVVATLAAILFFAGRALVQVLRGRRRLANAVARGLALGAEAAASALVVFYGVWGLNYARPDLVARLQLERPGATAPLPDASCAELEGLCAEALEATNRAYELAHGSPDLGRPSAPPVGIEPIDRAIDAAYERLAARLGLGAAFAASRGPAKPVLGSVAMSHAGIAGIYFPFTGEANFNRDLPGCTLPEVIAHEKAHQRGIASEDEANFMGFLACIASDEPYARYSGWLFALNQLGRELLRADRAAAERLLARRAPGVLRDLASRDAFWRRYQGLAERVGRKVNDTYLRAQGDRRGVLAYGFSVRLMVLLARSRGGKLDLGPGR